MTPPPWASRRVGDVAAFDRDTACACFESATGEAAADPSCSSALRLARERARDGL